MSDFLGNNLLVVDGLNLCFRWKHDKYVVPENELNDVSFEDALEFLREDMAEHYFKEELVDTINSIAASYKASKIVLLADFGQSKWRSEIYPEYKGNREADRAKNRPCDNAAFRVFFEAYSEAIKEIADEDSGIEVIFEKGIEADDVAAFICNNVVDNYDHIWMVTSDKDWDLLITDKVSRFNWMTKKTWKNIDKTGPRPREITLDNWNQHYKHSPEQHLGVKALMGDTGDNLPGIDGIGPVYALKLLDKYNGLAGVLKALPIKSSAKYIANLNANKELVIKNELLMDINSSLDKVIPPAFAERILATL